MKEKDDEKKKLEKNLEDDKIWASIGAKVKKKRELLGMSQNEICNLLAMQYSHLGAIEKGKKGASMVNLRGLAEVLDLNLHELITSTHVQDEPSFRASDSATEDNDPIQNKRDRIMAHLVVMDEYELDIAIEVLKKYAELKKTKRRMESPKNEKPTSGRK